MSKAKKSPQSKAPPRPRWLLPAIIVGIVLVVAAIVSVFAGSRRAAVEPEVKGAPRAEMAQTTIDHGAVRFETPVESVFRVRNVGDQPLTILNEPRVELVEGC